MTKHSAGMVENNGVGLAISWAQHAPDHLAIQTYLFGRARQDKAAAVGHVPAFSQHHAVGNKLARFWACH